ncbi:10654_t:CDS:1, partial [Scutellospora calospora]
GNRPFIPEHVPSFYAELIRMCWDALPENRPEMRKVADIFNYWRNKIITSGNNYPNANDHNIVHKEFQKADDFRLQNDFSSIIRFSKLHIDAYYSSRCHIFNFPKDLVVANLYSHKQSRQSASVRRHVIPDTGPLITPISDSIY